MDFLKRNKKIAIGIGVLIVAFIVYSVFFAGGDETGALVSETSTVSDADSDLIALLGDLRSLSLDEDFFDDRTFTSLVDFSIELLPQPIGRFNPFAPLSFISTFSNSSPQEDESEETPAG